VGIATVLTLAAWTDDGSAQAVFSTGNVDLKLNGADGISPAYDFASLSMSGMKDGSVKYGGLVVNNAGTLGFTYTMANTVTGDSTLASTLRVTVVTLTLGTACDATSFAAGTPFIAASALNGAGVAISSPRTLAVAASDTFCFKIDLPSGSPNSVQAKTTTATFAFTATQQ
jgi:hypothetical protein